jgi:sodium/potassium-transporting ATPase subunit alpha
MHIHELDIEQALASLGTGPQGLTAGQAERRLAEYGPNELARVVETPLFARLLLEEARKAWVRRRL